LVGGVGSADTILTGGAIGDQFGISMALGDINGDGYFDIAVGAYRYYLWQGSAYIFHSNGNSGISSVGTSSADTTLLGEAVNDQFGISIAISDINVDGYADVIIGATYSVGSYQGRSYIFYSKGVIGIVTALAGSAKIILTGGASNDYFGNIMAISDLNGDGYPDIAVGAYGVNVGGGANQGRVYIFYSNRISGSVNIDLSAGASVDITLTGGASGDYFGSALQ